MWRFFVALLCGCGGGPTASRDPVVPVEPDPVLTSMTIVLPLDTLVAGTTYQAGVAALDQKSRVITVASIAWASGNVSLLRVAADGTVLAMAEGSASVTATVGTVTARRTVTILPLPPGPVPVSSVQVTPFDIRLDVGASLTLSAALSDFAGRPLTGRAVVWKSNDESIAVVSADGTVTGRGTGTTTIEAMSETRLAAAQVVVLPQLDTSILVTAAGPVAGLAVDDTVTVIATARGSASIDSVIASVGAVHALLVYQALPSGRGLAWMGVLDISTIPIGPAVLVFTAFDARGRRGVVVVPIIHDPRLVTGGGKSPGGSK